MSNALYELDRDLTDHIHFSADIENNCDPHYHNQIEIIYIISGEQTVQINSTDIVLKEGQMAIADSYDIHSYIYREGTISTVIVIPIDLMNDYVKYKGNQSLKTNFILDKHAASSAYALIKKIQSCNKGLEVKGLINLMMSKIVSSTGLIKKKSKTFDYALIRRVLEYIESNYMNPISLTQISERFGYTTTHFSHIFNNYMRCNLNEYVNMVRLKQFFELKHKKPHMNLADLAFNVGFMSLPTFYRAFNKKYGMTPTQYFDMI